MGDSLYFRVADQRHIPSLQGAFSTCELGVDMKDDGERKGTVGEKAGWISLLGNLAATGLTILGVVYLMGYVVVNGYQAEYLNYAANAIQLKHLAAGFLYIFLTLFQIGVVAIFLIEGLVELKYSSKADDSGKASRSGENVPEESKLEVFKGRARSVFRYIWVFGRELVIAYIAVFAFFSFVGITYVPSQPAAFSVLKSCLAWTGINLGLSLVIMLAIYLEGSRLFRGLFEKKPRSGESRPQPARQENQPTARIEINQARRLFIHGLTGPWVAVPVATFALTLFSLVSFQGLYGHLKPDYGGGALYRVAVHLQPTSNLPEHVNSRIRSRDSWLLLVDKDANFLYVLSVDKTGKRSLLQIPLSEIKALEVFSSPPVPPADASLFIEQGGERKESPAEATVTE